MPKDNVERAIKKAMGKDQKDYKEMVYEGYGPFGIAVLVETATETRLVPLPTFAAFSINLAVLWVHRAAWTSCSVTSPYLPSPRKKDVCRRPYLGTD
jgi:hypothetical protein